MNKNCLTKLQVLKILNKSKIKVMTLYNKCTVVSAKLPNGFVIVESSGCIDPTNYNEDIGKEICMQKIEDKIWLLEGYCLQNKLAK